jgi:flagellin-like hook-associated protein FlgL
VIRVRITQGAIARTSLQGLNRNISAVGKLQEQLTSGKLITKPSDSPTGTNKAMQTRAEQASVDQQARNITDAKGWLDQTDSALQSMLTITHRVRDLTVQGLNTGSSSDTSRAALATEVASLREGLLALANGTIAGRPLFGGVTAGSKAYETDGSYLGTTLGTTGRPVTRQVSDTESVRIDITGREIFGPAGNDLFAVVDSIAKNLAASPADPTALTGHLAELDVKLDGMLTGIADVGSRAKRIELAEQINADRSLTLSSQLAETENVDLPNTIMRLQMQQTGYEAALSATAKAISPTLMDYLR